MLLLLLLLSVGLSSSKPLQFTSEREKTLIEIFGPNTNLTATGIVVADEAAGLGITAEEHLTHCFFSGEDMSRPLNEDEINEIVMEIVHKYKTVTFTSPEKVMDVLKVHLPKTHAGVVKLVGQNFELYEKFITEVGEDENVVNIMRNFKKIVLEALVSWSKTKNEPTKYVVSLGKAIGKMFDEYDNMPKQSKIFMEKKLCLKTTFRIIDNLIGEKGQITEIRKQMNLLVAMAQLMEKGE